MFRPRGTAMSVLESNGKENVNMVKFYFVFCVFV